MAEGTQEEPKSMKLVTFLIILLGISNTFGNVFLLWNHFGNTPQNTGAETAGTCSNAPSPPVTCPTANCPAVTCPDANKAEPEPQGAKAEPEPRGAKAEPEPRGATGSCAKRPHVAELLKTGALTVTFPLMTRPDPIWKWGKGKGARRTRQGLYAVEQAYKNEWRRQGVEEVFDLKAATFIVSKQAKQRGDDTFKDPLLIHKFGLCQEWGRHQVFNHVPRAARVVWKSKLAENFQRLARMRHDLAKDVAKLIPETYSLDSPHDCNDFQEKVDGGTWIHKQDRVHNAKGVELLDDEDAKEMAVKCRRRLSSEEDFDDDLGIMQHYIKKPFLIKDRKCDFRIYLYIALTDPFVSFYSPEFYIKCGHEAYDENSRDPFNVMTNTRVEGVNRDLQGADWSDLVLGPKQFQDYLIEKGYAADWLENEFPKQMKTKMSLVSHILDPTLLPSHQGSAYEVFGLDFILDEEDMNFWLIEVNPSPELVATRGARSQAVKSILSAVVGTQIDLIKFAASGRPRDSLALSDLPSRGPLQLISGLGA